MATSRSAPGSEAGPRIWRVLLPCLILVIGGALWRVPTLHQANYLQFAASHLSYSDVVAFHGTAIASQHQFPYVQQTIEYPVLTGLIVWLTGLAPGVEGYFAANALLLCGCLIGCLLLLARLRPPALLTRYALAPALFLYGVLNWDALALLCLTATILCVRKGRWGPAGVLLAAGACAKLFPGFILPVTLAAAWGADREEAGTGWTARIPLVPPAVLRLLLGFVAVALALNLPFALLNWHGWSYWLTFQAQRGANGDAIWSHLPYRFSEQTSRSLVAALSAGGILGAAIAVWNGGRWEAGALISLLVFLLTTKDYSPQYDLWALPLLASLACPIALWLVYVAADFLYNATTMGFYAVYAGAHTDAALAHAQSLIGVGVWAREIALALLAIWACSRLNEDDHHRGTEAQREMGESNQATAL